MAGKLGSAARGRGKANAKKQPAKVAKKLAVKVKDKETFDGKRRFTPDGLVALKRKYTDRKAWEQRRKAERPPPGGWPKPPAHWPPGVRVHIGRPVYWLPDGWGQGVKTTCAARLTCYVSPQGKTYYHRHVVEEVYGQTLGRPTDCKERSLSWAKGWAKDRISAGECFDRTVPNLDSGDAALFAQLTRGERALLPKPPALFFTVISARRADCESGLRAIAAVEAQLRAGGVKPTWYVDAESLPAYRQLGLRCKLGGKLVPARNRALEDAQRLGRACVQLSDDISHWHYLGTSADNSASGASRSFAASNEAARQAGRVRVGPVAAAQFLLAKLRTQQKEAGGGKNGPRLAGLFPLGNVGMAFRKEAVTRDNFILGDFFVAEASSPCRFDPAFSLKEDYDFTCAHLQRHGSVLRCNRLFIAAAHRSNEGGAVDARDAKGDKERANITLLQKKWPGVFRLNPNRGEGDTEVVLNWRWRRAKAGGMVACKAKKRGLASVAALAKAGRAVACKAKKRRLASISTLNAPRPPRSRSAAK